MLYKNIFFLKNRITRKSEIFYKNRNKESKKNLKLKCYKKHERLAPWRKQKGNARKKEEAKQALLDSIQSQKKKKKERTKKEGKNKSKGKERES